ncbi:lytic transglycosylase domain-containing protein [Tepidimonas charontis]|nr:lytic transglycosylase domain-containing protein [Tepidimonas charontis]
MARHALAAIGLAWLAGVAVLALQPDWRAELEREVTEWLLQRQATESLVDEAGALTERVLAADPLALPPAQARVAQWLARKYRVASEPLGALVAEAHHIGTQLQLDPTLILAVMAIESRFNPYAASPWGAHGLMQVHTRVHEDKLEPLGGALAVFDPLSNLRVGAEILRDAIRRAGSIPGGLRLYVGAVSTDGRDYLVKVLSEHERLKRVANGQQVGFQAAMPLPPLPAVDDEAAALRSSPLPAVGDSAATPAEAALDASKASAARPS